MHLESGLLQIYRKLEKWQWRHNFLTWCRSIWRCFVSFVKFSYLSKFRVSIITGSGVMTVSFYKELTRNPEITPSEFCPVSGDWSELGILNLARTSLMKSYWMLQNARVTAFTISRFLRENRLGRGIISPSPHPPKLGLMLW